MNTTLTHFDIARQQYQATPADCFELTIFPEQDCWEMSRNGIVTYDEADHMADGRTLFDARAMLNLYALENAGFECPCTECNA